MISCGPFVLSQLTGFKPGVIHALLRRYEKHGWIAYRDNGDLAIDAVAAHHLLETDGFSIERTRTREPHTVAEWAKHFPDDTLLLWIRDDREDDGHVVIAADGVVFDNAVPGGSRKHPRADQQVAFATRILEWPED